MDQRDDEVFARGDGARDLASVRVARELPDRHHDEVGIAELGVAVDEGAPERLGEQMGVAGASEGRQVGERLENVERLHHRHPA